MKQVMILESVGSCIDEEGCIYPLNCDGTPDFMITYHLDDVDEEFWDTISDEDSVRVYEVLEGKLNE